MKTKSTVPCFRRHACRFAFASESERAPSNMLSSETAVFRSRALAALSLGSLDTQAYH